MAREAKKNHVRSKTTESDSKAAPEADRRHRINELLWDFYGEFPLTISEWTSVAISGSRGERKYARATV